MQKSSMPVLSSPKLAGLVSPSIWMPVGILMVLGIVMVTSASIGISQREFGQPFYFAFKHLVSMALGLGAMLVGFLIPLSFWRDKALYCWLFSVFLLIVVLIPGVGLSINGAQRWLNLGFMTFQASELAKLATILLLASMLDQMRASLIQQKWQFLKPAALVCIVMALLLLEPDFGASAVIAMTAAAMLFISGAPLIPYLSLGFVGLLTMGGLAALAPYRVARLTAFMDPWADQFDTGYQLTQALIAFGRGEWFGVGIGRSVQKLFYLPEAFSDFLFAIIAEESGLLGGLAILFLYGWLFVAGFRTAHKAFLKEEIYIGFLTFGIVFWLSIQSMINIGVNTGMLPTKGLTLPLLSAGGSSILVTCFALGLVMRVNAMMGLSKVVRSKVVRY